MFGNAKVKIPAIVTFTDGKQMHCEIPPGNTPGLMSAISTENVFLEIYVDEKRKFFLREHFLSIEEDSEAVARRDEKAA